MSFAEGVREAREQYQVRQQDLAAKIPISNSYLCDIERGRRRPTEPIARALAEELDHPRVYIEASLQATGGVGSPYLDNVDRHRMAMEAKCREELQEVIAAFDRVEAVLINAYSRDKLTPEQLADIEQAIMEMIEAETALKNTVAELCVLYGISPRRVYRRHHEKLIQAGYLKKEKSAAIGAR